MFYPSNYKIGKKMPYFCRTGAKADVQVYVLHCLFQLIHYSTVITLHFYPHAL